MQGSCGGNCISEEQSVSWKRSQEACRPGKDSGFLSEDNGKPYMVAAGE